MVNKNNDSHVAQQDLEQEQSPLTTEQAGQNLHHQKPDRDRRRKLAQQLRQNLRRRKGIDGVDGAS